MEHRIKVGETLRNVYARECASDQTGPSTSIKPPRPPRVHQIKTRPCLKCASVFDSTWAGERICTPCKNKSEWKRAVA